ncbi:MULTISPECIES: ABC transporter substrate-binding protein [unclassified Microbacterium]|uniref:ABC transporter substrate-binding protein n=1 Tax=unclassified Microbacterium TaxID=2609290 RepID=UPI00365EFCD5
MEIFKKKHPDVKVEFERKTYEQMQQSGQLLLNTNDAPDVLEYLKGNATAGTVAKAGLLTDLTDVAKQRKWPVDGNVQDVGLYDSNGIMGAGKRYGITNMGEYVSVWYNKTLFEKNGLTVPKTLGEFENVMKAFTEKGVTPLAMSTSDYPGEHMLYQLALTHMDKKSWNAYQRFDGKVDWSAWEKGAQTMKDWADDGYIDKNSTGISGTDAGNGFITGKYPMFLSGTWWSGDFSTKIKDFQYDQFRFPDSAYQLGSGGSIWVVPQKAKNKELAYDFLDITMSPEVQNLLGNEGGVPVAADPSKVTTPIGQLTTKNFTALAAETDGGLAWYPDWPVAGLNDALIAQTANLVLGKSTPAQVSDALRSVYDQGAPKK